MQYRYSGRFLLTNEYSDPDRAFGLELSTELYSCSIYKYAFLSLIQMDIDIYNYNHISMSYTIKVQLKSGV